MLNFYIINPYNRMLQKVEPATYCQSLQDQKKESPISVNIDYSFLHYVDDEPTLWHYAKGHWNPGQFEELKQQWVPPGLPALSVWISEEEIDNYHTVRTRYQQD